MNITKSAVILCSLAALALSGCRPDVTAQAKRLDLNTVKPMSKTRADLAIAQAQGWIKEMPQNPRGYGALGQALMQRARETGRLDDYSGALTAFEKAVSLDDKNPTSLHNLAWCWTMFHRFPKALELSNKAIAINPSDPTAFGVKFDSEMELGHYQAAGVSGQKMLDLRPCLASYSRAAQYRWVLGDVKGAIMLMTKARDAGAPYAENSLWCSTQIGDYAFKSGNTLAAEQNYQRALDAQKDYKHALFGLGRVRIAQGKRKEGLGLMGQAVAQSCPVLYRIEYGNLLRSDGRIEEANRQFLKVDETIREHGSYGIQGDEVIQAELWLTQGIRKADALRLMELENKEHTNWQTYSALAWAQAANGQLAESKASILKGLECGVQEPILWARAAKILAANGETDAARRRQAAAESLNPYLASLVGDIPK